MSVGSDPHSSTLPSSSTLTPPAKMLYTDLPLELREQILACCTAKTLAYLSVTSKGITDEAEAMLYETISLHLSRESQLNACFRTLCDPASSRKARLIQTFAITFNYSESAQFADRTFIQLRIALKRMTSLKVLSVWAPEPLDFKWMGIGEILTRRRPTLRRLYLSGLNDLPQLLQCQPDLEVIGLWSTYTGERGTWPDKIKWQLARHLFADSPGRANGSQRSFLPAAPSAAHTQRPVLFEVEHDLQSRWDAIVRTLTIHDYPLEIASSKVVPNAVAQDGEKGERASTDFLAFHGRNCEIRRQLDEDLRLDFSRDKEWAMASVVQLVMRDLSPLSLRWARKVLAPILRSYPYQPKDYIRKPFVGILIINPPTPSTLNMTHIGEPLKQLLATCLYQKVNYLGMRNYSEAESPDVGYTVTEEESGLMAGAFAQVADEVVRDAGPGAFEHRFDLNIFEEEIAFLQEDL